MQCPVEHEMVPYTGHDEPAADQKIEQDLSSLVRHVEALEIREQQAENRDEQVVPSYAVLYYAGIGQDEPDIEHRQRNRGAHEAVDDHERAHNGRIRQ